MIPTPFSTPSFHRRRAGRRRRRHGNLRPPPREALVALAIPANRRHRRSPLAALRLAQAPPRLIAVALALTLLAGHDIENSTSLLPCLYVAGVSISFLIIATAALTSAEMQNLFNRHRRPVTPETRASSSPPS